MESIKAGLAASGASPSEVFDEIDTNGDRCGECPNHQTQRAARAVCSLPVYMSRCRHKLSVWPTSLFACLQCYVCSYLSFEEFKTGVIALGMDLSEQKLAILFQAFVQNGGEQCHCPFSSCRTSLSWDSQPCREFYRIGNG